MLLRRSSLSGFQGVRIGPQSPLTKKWATSPTFLDVWVNRPGPCGRKTLHTQNLYTHVLALKNISTTVCVVRFVGLRARRSKIWPIQHTGVLNAWFCRFWGSGRPPAARPTKPLFSGTCIVFWPWYPRPPKNHMANTQHRDPFDQQ